MAKKAPKQTNTVTAYILCVHFPSCDIMSPLIFLFESDCLAWPRAPASHGMSDYSYIKDAEAEHGKEGDPTANKLYYRFSFFFNFGFVIFLLLSLYFGVAPRFGGFGDIILC